jgi:hypothetical protein
MFVHVQGYQSSTGTHAPCLLDRLQSHFCCKRLTWVEIGLPPSIPGPFPAQGEMSVCRFAAQSLRPKGDSIVSFTISVLLEKLGVTVTRQFRVNRERCNYPYPFHCCAGSKDASSHRLITHGLHRIAACQFP